MQVKDSYDLIVVGDQLCGLFLAAGAAQKGLRVLVLEGQSAPSVIYEVPSGKFLVDLLAEPLVGINSGSKVDRFCKELGLYNEIDALFPEHKEFLQIITPRQRFNCRFNRSELKRDLAREFPDYSSDVLADLLSGDTVARDSFANMVKKANLPVEWEQFGALPSKLFGNIHAENLSYGAYHEITSLAKKGVRYLRGGRSALKEHLLSKISLFGGTVKKSTWVDEIIFERGRLAGVLLSSYEGFVRSPIVVGALGARTFYQLVPEKLRPASFGKLAQNISPTHWRFNFSLMIPDMVVPEGMAGHVALFDPSLPLEEENFLQIQKFPKDVYGGVPAGHSVFVVRVLMPLKERNRSKNSLFRVLKRSLDKIQTAVPFLYENALEVFPDPLKPEHETTFERYYQYPSLEHIPPSFLVYESLLNPSLDNTNLMDWANLGLPGLALCSRDIRPLLGLTGEIFTALEMLGKIEKRRRAPL